MSIWMNNLIRILSFFKIGWEMWEWEAKTENEVLSRPRAPRWVFSRALRRVNLPCSQIFGLLEERYFIDNPLKSGISRVFDSLQRWLYFFWVFLLSICERQNKKKACNFHSCCDWEAWNAFNNLRRRRRILKRLHFPNFPVFQNLFPDLIWQVRVHNLTKLQMLSGPCWQGFR